MLPEIDAQEGLLKLLQALVRNWILERDVISHEIETFDDRISSDKSTAKHLIVLDHFEEHKWQSASKILYCEFFLRIMDVAKT